MKELEESVKILRENDLKVTPQRLAILKFVRTHMTHPTAEEIYSALKKNNPSLSKTTVYNALESLKEHNIIQELTICVSEHRYDFIGDTHHHHFLCKKCGRIIDIDIECPNMHKVTQFGHKVDEIHGYFKGTCKDCLEKES